MAILSDKTIKEYLEEGKIVIDSLKDEQQIQPSSVDMRLGDEFKVFKVIRKPYIDPKDEEDIAVPKSEYIDNVDEIKEEVQDESAIAKVLVDDIRVAYPKDSTQPYSHNCIELSEDSDIAELSLKDFDILAFAYGSEEQIEIVEPAYEEN